MSDHSITYIKFIQYPFLHISNIIKNVYQSLSILYYFTTLNLFHSISTNCCLPNTALRGFVGELIPQLYYRADQGLIGNSHAKSSNGRCSFPREDNRLWSHQCSNIVAALSHGAAPVRYRLRPIICSRHMSQKTL